MNFYVISENMPFLMAGYVTTLQLTAITVVGGFVLGIPLAIARASKLVVALYPAMALIEIVRGIPVLLLLFWIYFGLPRYIGSVSEYTAAALGLVIFNAIYSAEIIRAGIGAVSLGNVEAGRATGLNRLHILRHIVIPQAIYNMTPALVSQIVMVYKTTSIIFVLGIVDFFRAAMLVDSREYKSFEIYLFVAFVYFVPSTVLSSISRVIERRRMIGHGTLLHP